MLGRPQDAAASSSSYVWSDQYGLRLQVAGAAVGEQVHVLHADPGTGQHLTLIGRRGRVAGAVGYGGRTGFAQAKKWVSNSAPWQETIRTNAGVSR